MGEKGHNIYNCIMLKYEVQALIDSGILEFDKMESNVQQNPSLEHKEVNIIFDEEGIDKSKFLIDVTKLQEVPTKAVTHLVEREVVKKEKMLCLEKLTRLGIIGEVDGPMEGGVRSIIDLSLKKFILKIANGGLWRIPMMQS